MAKADWNYFEFNAPSEGESAFLGVHKDDAPTEVSTGGSNRSLKCEHAVWSGAAQRPIFGYMYNGPDSGEFPIQDLSISAAIRTQSLTAECVGVIVRSQINLNGVISDPNDLNFYMVGVRLSSTVNDNSGAVDVLKVVIMVSFHLAC